MYKLALLVTVLLLSSTQYAFSLSGSPNKFFDCDAPEFFSIYKKVQCAVRDSAYIPPTANWEYPVTFIVPQNAGPHRIRVKLSGYSARPYDFCTDLNFSQADAIVVKPCAGHFPDYDMHAVNGVKPLGWWGRYRGDSNSMRLGLSLSRALQEGNPDLDAGIMLEGSSYGGTGSILQSMMLRQSDAFWGEQIAIVQANVPHTLFVKNWSDYAPINIAWEGYDRSGADVETQMANGSLNNIYYRVNGSPADTSVIFDTEFFRLCDRYTIACFGTWHAAGHNLVEQGINLPFTALYAAKEMDVRLDNMLPVFTNSTANHWGAQRGHYNLGLSWAAGIYLGASKLGVAIPVRYKAHRNIGGGVPDQPNSATFDLTIRRMENFSAKVGTQLHWELGEQTSGTVEVTVEGEVTIKGLQLTDSIYYTGLVITPDTAGN